MDQYLVIISGVSVFLVISYFLVTILYIAEKKLVSQEDVSININEDTYGIKKNEQLPYLNKKQKIYWGENTEEFGFIKNKVELFLDNQI